MYIFIIGAAVFIFFDYGLSLVHLGCLKSALMDPLAASVFQSIAMTLAAIVFVS